MPNGQSLFSIEAQKAALRRGGKCLAFSHTNAKGDFLRFQCEHQHVWIASARKIAAGSWCVACAKSERTWNRLQAIVSERKGTLLTPRSEFRGFATQIGLQCERGHSWQVTTDSVLKGQWCRRCHVEERRTPLNELRMYARSRGGELVSDRHPDKGSKYTWRCAEGHLWEADSKIATRAFQWCRKCSFEKQKYTMEEMRALADKHGGQCLSNTYLGVSNKLRWRCKEGHQWENTPALTMEGYWCKLCESPRVYSLERLQALVGKKGGKVLSEEYVDSYTKMEFRCAEGHTWYTNPNAIVAGHWCHTCTNNQRGSIEKMQAIASQFGGKCLSKVYSTNKTKLLWRCKNGHEFWKKPNQVTAAGQWCNDCAVAQRQQARS